MSECHRRRRFTCTRTSPLTCTSSCPTPSSPAAYARENETKPPVTLQLEGAETPQDVDEVGPPGLAGVEKGYYLIVMGAMDNSPRDNWFVDTLMAWMMPFILAFVMWDMNTRISAWGNKKKGEGS